MSELKGVYASVPWTTPLILAEKGIITLFAPESTLAKFEVKNKEKLQHFFVECWQIYVTAWKTYDRRG